MYRPALAAFLVTCLTPFAEASDAVQSARPGSQTAIGDQAKRLNLINVELSPNGTLNGRVLDASGKSIVGVIVAASRQTAPGKSLPAVLSNTDANGRFSVAMSHGSVCVLQIGEWLYPCRTWKHGTAPPKSVKDIALVISDEPIVRGQRNRVRRVRPGMTYGLAAVSLGGVAAYMALSRDNASE